MSDLFYVIYTGCCWLTALGFDMLIFEVPEVKGTVICGDPLVH